MTVRFYWQLDAAADPRRAAGEWRYHHYGQIARAAALTGFDGLFIAHRPDADDSQIIAASLARLTPTLQLIAEFPASVGSAVYAAKEAVSFQRNTHGRLGWAIAGDPDAETRAREGDLVADGDLLARREEFVAVARGVHGQTGFTYKGRFFEVLNGGFEAPLNRVAFPPLFLQGTLEEELELSARQADVHLFEAASADELRSHIELLDRLASREGRAISYGVRVPLLAREFADEADNAETYDAAADRLVALAALGIDHFVLSASPSLEEAYRVGQHVLPRVRQRLGAYRVAA